MAKTIAPLNTLTIKNAKPKAQDYVLSDGDGLYLIVRKSGTKNFQFKYSHPITKQRHSISLGAFPDISLSDARDKTREMRRQIALGVDPADTIKSEKAVELERLSTTFFIVAENWIEIKKTRVSADYAQDIWRSLECHVFPKLGNTPITAVNAPDTIKILNALRQKGSFETLTRICQRLNEIMIYATNIGLINHNPIAGIKSAFPAPQTKSFPSITREQLPEFLQRLKHANIFSLTRSLIEFQLHTMTRPNEAASAEWEEIDFEKNTWTIPAKKMKMKRDHVIPLSRQMAGLLNYLRSISFNSPYIFPAIRDRRTHLNSSTANMAIKRMGYKGKLVAHGLRSLASTVLNEQEYNRDWIEAALAHIDTNQIRAVYNRAIYLDQRREMMQWWSDFIDSCSININSD